MHKVFKGQIGKSMEVYVDNMIVKSMEVRNHLDDLGQYFLTIQRHNMRLNPTKCTFAL